MNKPIVSIVTIAKNYSKGLYRTLESVKEQDYQEIQHIIVDGDSNDGTKQLLESYSHSKMYIYTSEPDTGISSAFNKGLEKSNSNLIFFLNAGDVLLSDSVISQVVQSYLQHKWRCAIGITIATSITGETVYYRPPRLSSKFLKYFMFLPHQGFFCETSLHKNYRYDESIKTSMDYELFLRMLKNVEIFYLPFIVSIREPGGVSSQTNKRISEHSTIRMKYAQTIYEKFIVVIINALIRLKANLRIDSPFAAKRINS